jgi:uncharacterized coiled-coil protein SlyX
MATLYTKTKLYIEANSKTWDDTKVSLQDDMIDGVSSPYIKSWTYDGLAKPSDSKIAEYETAGNTAETLNGVLNKRAREYKELKEQLDLLYHDMVADKGDKTGEWFKHIKAVKDANPKE